MGKSTKDQRDHFYRQGKQEGFRARSAFKLLHLDEQYGLFGRPGHSLAARVVGQDNVGTRSSDAEAHLCALLGNALGHEVYTSLMRDAHPPTAVIDLCAAPGSWSQVLSRQLRSSGACIVAVDLQYMAPLDGVTQVVGDITTRETAQAVEQAFYDAQRSPYTRVADLIVCDGAPDVTGLQMIDEFLHSQLLAAAVTMVSRMLRRDGTFVAKVFAEPGSSSTNMLMAQLRRLFLRVELAKPRSSRASSAEHFVVCMGFLGPKHDEDSSQIQPVFLGDLQGYNAAST